MFNHTILGIVLAISWVLSVLAVSPRENAEHDFYVSVIEIRKSPGETESTLQIRVFSDDLQAALQSHFHQNATTPIDSICSGNTGSFFSHHVRLRINEKYIALDTIATCERIGDTHVFLYSFGASRQWNTIELQADYFFDLFPGQIQMVHLKYPDNNKTFRLHKRESTKSIQLSH